MKDMKGMGMKDMKGMKEISKGERQWLPRPAPQSSRLLRPSTSLGALKLMSRPCLTPRSFK
jgi:hypothetical protein